MIAAVGLHLLLFLALWVGSRCGAASGSGSFARGSDPMSSGSPMMVSLISAEAINNLPIRSPETPAPAADPLLKLLRKSLAHVPSVLHTSTQTARPASLDRLIAEADRRQMRSEKMEVAKAHYGDSANENSATRSANQPRGSSGSQTDGLRDLSAAVEPCWRRALDRSRVPVTLEVTLDARGADAVPPKVTTLGAGDREAQRVAVERALQAIAACLPVTSGGVRAGRYGISFGITKP